VSARKESMKFERTNVRRVVGCLGLFLMISAAASLCTQSASAQDAAKPAPAPPSASSGLISDFDNGTAETKFGMGWVISTDTIMGGKSSGEMKVIDGGANKDPHALDVSGLIDGGLPFAWAGVMFSPGDQPFAPVNLSAHKSISFWTKGDGQTYRILVFTASGGRMPAQQTFEAGKEWKKISFPFSDFNGTDGHDIAAILFVGGPAAG
jgi:hypothetical protein